MSFLPLEHPPREAQVDFGEDRFIENGIAYESGWCLQGKIL
jgi:hypothetical protein